ncbi:Protein kinase domain-containing protein [Aphelenchoides bicaudatus]|nr:Protein kinase domain-containing protein [Aphelenchoides bicaudatus]
MVRSSDSTKNKPASKPASKAKSKDKSKAKRKAKSRPNSKDDSKASKRGAGHHPPPKKEDQTAMVPATFADDRTMTNQLIRADNAVQKVEYAKNMAQLQARLTVGNIVRTTDHHYEVLGEVEKCIFGFKYEVEQRNVNRKRYFLRTEPLTRQDNVTKFKTLKHELMILKLAKDLNRKSTKSIGAHIPKFHDVGATSDFKFVISQALGPSLYDITRKELKSAFSPSTALRVSIQMLRAIRDLHSLGFLHRHLKPESFAIGRGHHLRTIFFNDGFGEPFEFRDPETKRIKRARKQVRIIGVLRYMSRNSQLNKEHGRRDDLESWVFLSMEFFDLTVLPWRSDQVNSAVLDKKQKLIDGAYPAVFTEKNIDFDLPYDWENLNLRPVFGRDPKRVFDRVLQQDPVRVAKPKKKKHEVSAVTPTTLQEDEPEISARSVVTPKTPIGKTYMDKIIDVHMTGDGVNENEKFLQRGRRREGRRHRKHRKANQLNLLREWLKINITS